MFDSLNKHSNTRKGRIVTSKHVVGDYHLKFNCAHMKNENIYGLNRKDTIGKQV